MIVCTRHAKSKHAYSWVGTISLSAQLTLWWAWYTSYHLNNRTSAEWRRAKLAWLEQSTSAEWSGDVLSWHDLNSQTSAERRRAKLAWHEHSSKILQVTWYGSSIVHQASSMLRRRRLFFIRSTHIYQSTYRRTCNVVQTSPETSSGFRLSILQGDARSSSSSVINFIQRRISLGKP